MIAAARIADEHVLSYLQVGAHTYMDARESAPPHFLEGISIGSAVFAGLMVVTNTHRQTVTRATSVATARICIALVLAMRPKE